MTRLEPHYSLLIPIPTPSLYWGIVISRCCGCSLQSFVRWCSRTCVNTLVTPNIGPQLVTTQGPNNTSGVVWAHCWRWPVVSISIHITCTYIIVNTIKKEKKIIPGAGDVSRLQRGVGCERMSHCVTLWSGKRLRARCCSLSLEVVLLYYPNQSKLIYI